MLSTQHSRVTAPLWRIFAHFQSQDSIRIALVQPNIYGIGKPYIINIFNKK